MIVAFMFRVALRQVSCNSLFMRSTPSLLRMKEKKSAVALALISGRFNSGVDRRPLISILHAQKIEIGGKQ